jgi:hypothetical protein
MVENIRLNENGPPVTGRRRSFVTQNGQRAKQNVPEANVFM